jgi:hypothetical protein
MAYGLKIENPTNELVLSDDGFVAGFVGKASLVGTSQADKSNLLDMFGGGSSFSITFAGQIVPVLKLNSTYSGRIGGFSRSGDVWTIGTINADTSSIDADGFTTQVAPEVYVFGIPDSVTGYGMALFTPAGVPAGNLILPPLVVAQRLQFAAGDGLVSRDSSIVTPGLLGRSLDYRRTVHVHGVKQDFLFYGSAFGATSTQLSRSFDLRERVNDEDGTGGTNETLLNACSVFIVELDGLG